MKFVSVEMLFFEWLVPVLFFLYAYGMRKRRTVLSRFSSEKGLQAIAPDTGGGRRRWKAALLLAAVFFMVLSLSGPQVGYRWQEIKQKGVDIIIAIDCSRSMLAGDIHPSRLERAKHEITDLIAMLSGDRVGIVAFAGTAFLQCPLTLDYNAFHIFLDALSPDFLPVGGTDITGALTAAADGFENTDETEKAVILITDGENTGDGDPVAAAEVLKKKNIRLYCIGVGSGEGVPVPDADGGFTKDRSGNIILSRLDETTLKQMAVATSGAYVRSVAGDMDLDWIYHKEIRGKMEAATVSSGRKQIWQNRFQWPLAAALICLLVEMAIPVSRKAAKIALAAMLVLLLPAAGKAIAGPVSDGLAAYDSGDYRKAVTHFVEAQLKHPENPEIAFNIGNAYYKTGDYSSAMANYQQALGAAAPPLKEKVLYNMGNTAFRMGKPEEAVKNYEAVLTIDPEDRQAKENLAFVKQTMQQKQPPRQNRQTGDDRNPSNDDSGSKDAHPRQQKDNDRSAKDGGPGDEGETSAPKKTDTDKQQGASEKKNDQPKGQTEASAGDTGQKESAGSDADKGIQTGETDSGRAERILNRLDDLPGRALMPDYRKETVEKDW